MSQNYSRGYINKYPEKTRAGIWKPQDVFFRQRESSWKITDPFFSLVDLWLSTNETSIIDKSLNSSNTIISRDVPVSTLYNLNSSTSLLLNTTNSLITIQNSLSWVGDFTVETFFYPLAFGNTSVFWIGSQNNTFQIGRNGTLNRFGVALTGVAWEFEQLFLPQLNQWHHLAVVKKDNTGYLFFNGNLTATKMNYTSTLATSTIFIGNISSGIFPLNMAIDTIRKTNYARYLTNFNPYTDSFLI